MKAAMGMAHGEDDVQIDEALAVARRLAAERWQASAVVHSLSIRALDSEQITGHAFAFHARVGLAPS